MNIIKEHKHINLIYIYIYTRNYRSTYITISYFIIYGIFEANHFMGIRRSDSLFILFFLYNFSIFAFLHITNQMP